MNDITQPLRLATGNHKAGTGQGCAMNVLSWENGDTTITDLPACTDRMLAYQVQRVNDKYCNQTEFGPLCPQCSVKVLALAHRTVGTGTLNLTGHERFSLWVQIAALIARSLETRLNDFRSPFVGLAKAEAWVAVNGFVAPDRVRDARAIADAFPDTGLGGDAALVRAAQLAFLVAEGQGTSDGRFSARHPIAGFLRDGLARFLFAHAGIHSSPDETFTAGDMVVDMFSALTGFTPQPPDPHQTTMAVNRMMVVG